LLKQFPITALREIKLLKLLSHENILKLEEMAVEHAQKGSKFSKATQLLRATHWRWNR
jgi:serine/threonine-protein kinase BUR1